MEPKADERVMKARRVVEMALRDPPTRGDTSVADFITDPSVEDFTENLMFAVNDLETHDSEWLFSKLRDAAYPAAHRLIAARYVRSADKGEPLLRELERTSGVSRYCWP